MGIQLHLKIPRRKNSLRDDIAMQIGHVKAFEIGENALGIPRSFHTPVEIELSQMRHPRKHIESFATRWRQIGIRLTGSMQAEREIIRQTAAPENTPQQFPVTRPEQNIMMEQVGIFSPRAEVDEKQRHAVIHLSQPSAHAPSLG